MCPGGLGAQHGRLKIQPRTVAFRSLPHPPGARLPRWWDATSGFVQGRDRRRHTRAAIWGGLGFFCLGWVGLGWLWLLRLQTGGSHGVRAVADTGGSLQGMRLKQAGDRITGAQGRQGMGSNEGVIGIYLGGISLGGWLRRGTSPGHCYNHPYLMYLITRPITVHGGTQGVFWHQCRGEAVDAAGLRFLWLVCCKGTG